MPRTARSSPLCSAASARGARSRDGCRTWSVRSGSSSATWRASSGGGRERNRGRTTAMSETLETKGPDARPALAVGHVEIYVRRVAPTAEFLVRLGARPIAMREDLAVLELRGGTHLVVMPRNSGSAVAIAPSFDLMVDDIEAAHKLCTELGV